MNEKRTHPSYGLLQFSHTRGGNPKLFGSNILHNEKIECTIRHAEVERKLNQDWYYGKKTAIQVEMSYAQFAQAICSMNIGEGVPCTITYTEQDGIMPTCDFKNESTLHSKELHETIHQAAQNARKLAKDTADILSKKSLTKKDKEYILSTLHQLCMEIDQNAAFVFDQFDRHMEQTVSNAKSEIEAFMTAKMNSIATDSLLQMNNTSNIQNIPRISEDIGETYEQNTSGKQDETGET